jgi:hypothetical protein
MAIVTTEWRYGSHAWHMGERFLVGYPRDGQWHRPDLTWSPSTSIKRRGTT